MRKLLRVTAIMLVFIFVTIVFGPPLAGVILQHHYHQLLSFYNATGSIQIVTEKYQRGWLSSDVKLAIKIINPSWQIWLQKIGVSGKAVFTLEQHVKHGPLFYDANYVPYAIGLAVIKSNIGFPPELIRFFAAQGVTQEVLQIDDDFITLTGGYKRHVKLTNLHLLYPKQNIEIKLAKGDFDFLLVPRQYHMSGKINLSGFFIKDKTNSLTVPAASLQFEQQRTTQGLWAGRQSVTLPTATFSSQQGQQSRVQQTIGPLHLQLSESKINVNVFADMLATYHAVMQGGELYRNQLKNKLTHLLPNIIGAGSNVKITQFNVMTSKGMIDLSGTMEWPIENFVAPTSLTEIWQLSDGQLMLHVPKLLLQDLIQYVAGLTYFMQDAIHEERALLQDVDDQIDFTIRKNAFLMDNLINMGVLSEKNGVELLTMQRKFVPLEQYAAYVKELFLERKITLVASYYLYLLYAEVMQPYEFLEHKVDEYQKVTAQDMQDQLMDFLKEGYLTEDKDNYSLSLIWSPDKIVANGHPVDESAYGY